MNRNQMDKVGDVYEHLNQLVLMINGISMQYNGITNLLRKECKSVLLDAALWLTITTSEERDRLQNSSVNHLRVMNQILDTSISRHDITPRNRNLLIELRSKVTEMLEMARNFVNE